MGPSSAGHDSHCFGTFLPNGYQSHDGSTLPFHAYMQSVLHRIRKETGGVPGDRSRRLADLSMSSLEQRWLRSAMINDNPTVGHLDVRLRLT